MLLKEAGKANFRAIMSWTMTVVQEEVTLVHFTLRADMVIRLWAWGICCLRTGMGWDVVFGGLLHLVLLNVDNTS